MKLSTSLSLFSCLLLTSSLSANSTQTDTLAKRSLKNNMNITYNKLPKNVATIGAMLSEGEYYARIRSNTFYWDWKEESDSLKDNRSMGLGASLIYKTAYLNGFGVTAGAYTTYAPSFFRPHPDDIGFAKAGKDTFNRHEVEKNGYTGNSLFAQAYAEYKKDGKNIKIGRQLFHSVFTASNDTKMIPNTFDGITYSDKTTLPQTTFRAAFFVAQKLRDHATSHDVITFNTQSGDKWNNNDDSAGHKGLSYANFIAHNKDPNHDMTIIDCNNRSIKNLNVTFSYAQIPGVIRDGVIEAHYKIPLFATSWAVRPGFRYFYQKDNGGGKIAGNTNLTGKEAIGYNRSVTQDNSLNSSLIAARTDILMPNKKGFIRFGYSHIEDKADIVAPWRGFPTGGYTRAMAQYNWYANTTSYMMQANYNFTSQFIGSVRYAIQDFDDNKDNVQADSNILHIDTITKISKNLEIKTRLGIASVKNDIVKSDGSTKSDLSYNEYRLEFNYLF